MIRRAFVIALLAGTACTTPQDPERGRTPGAEVIDAGLDEDAAVVGHVTDASTTDASPADASPPEDDCAAAPVDRFTGTARRDNTGGYPDHIQVTGAWQRTGTVGCVDSYAPSGTAVYGYAIPGALCAQSIDPDTQAVAASDGVLTVDRTTSPPTYTARAATHWTVTFRCDYGDGTYDEHSFLGGAPWFDASGAVDGDTIAGVELIDDDETRCGPEGIPPCQYEWSFRAE